MRALILLIVISAFSVNCSGEMPLIQYNHSVSAITEIFRFLEDDGKVEPKFQSSLLKCLEEGLGNRIFDRIEINSNNDFSGVVLISGKSDHEIDPGAIRTAFQECFKTASESPLKEKIGIRAQEERSLDKEIKYLESTIFESISLLVDLQQVLTKCDSFSKYLGNGSTKATPKAYTDKAVLSYRVSEISRCVRGKPNAEGVEFLRAIAKHTNEENRLIGLRKQHSRVNQRVYSVKKDMAELNQGLETRPGLASLELVLNSPNRSLQKKVLVLIVSFAIFVLASVFIAKRNGYA